MFLRHTDTFMSSVYYNYSLLESTMHDQTFYDSNIWEDCPSMFSRNSIPNDIASPYPADYTATHMAHPLALPGHNHAIKSMEGGEESIKQSHPALPKQLLKSESPSTTDNLAVRPLPISIEQRAFQIAAKPPPDAKAMNCVFPRPQGNPRKPLSGGGLSAFKDGVEEELGRPTYEAYEMGEVSILRSSAEYHLTEGTALQSTNITSCSVNDATAIAEVAVDNPIDVDGHTGGDTETNVSIEDQVKDEEGEMEETYNLLKSLLRTYTAPDRRPKGALRKRSFEAYCLLYKLDNEANEDNAVRYLEWQGDWVDELLKATKAVNAHLHSRKKKLCGALSRPRQP